jgi:hypothetical protein
MIPVGSTGLSSSSAPKFCATSSDCLAGPSIDGVAKHVVGMNTLKHVSAMSHNPANLRFLNKIELLAMSSKVILLFEQLLQN